MLLVAGLAVAASAQSRPSEKAEIETVYRSMTKAFASKSIRGYSSFWAPAVRWFPPKSKSTTLLTRSRAELLHDLVQEFSKRDRVSQEFVLARIETEVDRATVDLAVITTHIGPSTTSTTLTERHHWLKAGGRWWLSRIEAIG